MSRWLDNEIKEIDEFRGNKKKIVPYIIIVFAIMLGYFTYSIIKNSKNSQEVAQGLIGIGIMAFILILVTILVVFINNKKGNPSLEKNVARICTTNDDTEQFDTEMTNEPIKTKKAGSMHGDIKFTEHYLVQIKGRIPLKSYLIVKLDEIKSINFCGVRDNASLTGLGREYWIDLIDVNNKKIDMIRAAGKNTRDEFFDAITHVIPEITIKKV